MCRVSRCICTSIAVFLDGYTANIYIVRILVCTERGNMSGKEQVPRTKSVEPVHPESAVSKGKDDWNFLIKALKDWGLPVAIGLGGLGALFPAIVNSLNDILGLHPQSTFRLFTVFYFVLPIIMIQLVYSWFGLGFRRAGAKMKRHFLPVLLGTIIIIVAGLVLGVGTSWLHDSIRATGAAFLFLVIAAGIHGWFLLKYSNSKERQYSTAIILGLMGWLAIIQFTVYLFPWIWSDSYVFAILILYFIITIIITFVIALVGALKKPPQLPKFLLIPIGIYFISGVL